MKRGIVSCCSPVRNEVTPIGVGPVSLVTWFASLWVAFDVDRHGAAMVEAVVCALQGDGVVRHALFESVVTMW